MSETVKLESVKGVVERVNRGGVRIAGTWYNFDRSFKDSDKPGKEIVDSEIELAVADGGNGKKYIHAFELCGTVVGDADGDEPAVEAAVPNGDSESAETPAKFERRITDEQVKCVEVLLKETGLTHEDLAQLTQIRFKKKFADLNTYEGSRTIKYLSGGRPFDGRRSKSQ